MPLADPDEVWRSDTVDLRRLTHDYPKHVRGANFKLVFTFIGNPRLRSLVKRYFRARIAFWRPATFKPYLKHIKPFFTRLGEQYPDLDSFAEVTKPMIEPLLHLPCWIDQNGKQHPITPYRRAKMAGVLDGMFTYMRLHDWAEAPPRQLIFYEDKLGRPVRRQRPIPENIMQQLVRTSIFSIHTRATSLRSCALPDFGLKTLCICERTAIATANEEINMRRTFRRQDLLLSAIS